MNLNKIIKIKNIIENSINKKNNSIHNSKLAIFSKNEKEEVS